MSLESMPSRGEDLARSYQETGPKLISLEDSPAQVFLSQTAYPNLPPEQALMKWIADDADTFRTYLEERKERGESLDVDIRDHDALHGVLEEMRGGETLH